MRFKQRVSYGCHAQLSFCTSLGNNSMWRVGAVSSCSRNLSSFITSCSIPNRSSRCGIDLEMRSAKKKIRTSNLYLWGCPPLRPLESFIHLQNLGKRPQGIGLRVKGFKFFTAANRASQLLNKACQEVFFVGEVSSLGTRVEGFGYRIEGGTVSKQKQKLA